MHILSHQKVHDFPLFTKKKVIGSPAWRNMCSKGVLQKPPNLVGYNIFAKHDWKKFSIAVFTAFEEFFASENTWKTASVSQSKLIRPQTPFFNPTTSRQFNRLSFIITSFRPLKSQFMDDRSYFNIKNVFEYVISKVIRSKTIFPISNFRLCHLKYELLLKFHLIVVCCNILSVLSFLEY